MKKWKKKEIESKSKFKTLNIDGTRYKTNLISKFENRKKYTVPDYFYYSGDRYESFCERRTKS